MPPVDLFIKNAIILTEEATFKGGIAVQDGKIVKVFEGENTVRADEIINAEGRLLLPGIVDCHVHLNEPGRTDWEGYGPGSFAAAAGGTTTLMEMPFNSLPITRDISSLDAKRAAVYGQSIVDYGLWALLENTNLEKLADLHAEGVVAFKAFMCNPGEFEMIGTYELYQAMQKTRDLGSLVGVHAESEPLAWGFTRDLQASGRKDPRAYAESRPPLVELEAAQRAIMLAEKSGCRLHLCHTTLPEIFDQVQTARSRGARVTAECCPHYLAFDEDDLAAIGPNAKCSPPLRKRDIVEDLWKRVLHGQVQVISSDHSPCKVELKSCGRDDIWKAWGGVNSIQMLLSVLLTEGVHKRGLSLNTVVRMACLNPAKIFGLYPAKGHLGEGADADMILIDPESEWTLSASMLFSRHQISPFLGRAFKGLVERTILRGQTIYLNGEVIVQPGYGRFVQPLSSTYLKKTNDRFSN